MKKRLSTLTAPAVAGVVREKTKQGAIAEIKNCIYHGADMIDLHMSCLEDPCEENLKAIVDSCKLPILALNYNRDYYWNDTGFPEEERVESFLRAMRAGVAGVDIQGYTFHAESRERFCGENKYSFTKNNPKEVVTDEVIIAKQCDLIEKIHGGDCEVLLSCHPGIVMNSTQVVELALFMEKRNPDIIKIVTKAENEDDVIESFKAMSLLKKKVKTPVSYHTNGKAGSLSRIVNPLLGGQIIFCVDRYSENSIMEQLDLKTVRTIVDNMKKI